jgi:hypothetical protein
MNIRDVDNLTDIGMVIDTPGFKAFEKDVVTVLSGWDHASRVTGNAFDDGLLKGRVEGYKDILSIIAAYRKRLKEMEDGK